MKFVYGNPIQIFAGTNLDNLEQILRNNRNGRNLISFVVPKNMSKILLVAGNEINTFDFTVTDPAGRQYDFSNSAYKKYESVKKTVMIIDKPKSGEWEFETEQTGDINFYPLGINQKPSQIVSNPLTQRSHLI
ncbi:MAG: hypothetical protein IPL53_03975 [Ignavibacteria bacterium]|nr:hypothetical protein [Ignavibacteria bacterium]